MENISKSRHTDQFQLRTCVSLYDWICQQSISSQQLVATLDHDENLDDEDTATAKPLRKGR